MKKNDILLIVGVAFVTGIFSLILSTVLFGGQKKHTEKVPISQTIKTTFPDVQNDPSYNSFLNANALDPAQPIQVGNSQNNQPFNGSQ
jgi:hypothetical protein